jgi:hypothetical protein
MWNLRIPQCGLHCKFFNIPTILSLSPDAVFVPEDVAKRDGLKW